MGKCGGPGTTYSNNSGGEPADIPDLTHEQLLAFHAEHYSPANAYFYTYGDLPLHATAAAIDAAISAVPSTGTPPKGGAQGLMSTISDVPRFERPVQHYTTRILGSFQRSLPMLHSAC